MSERIELRPGYSICRLIAGGWQLSAGHRPGETASRDPLADLQHLVEAGFTTFDCADIYTGVEELYGRLIREHRRGGGRSDLQIHTKCVPDADLLPRLRRQDLERTVHRSLRRLGVERLDLVQFHWWDWNQGDWLEALGWLDALRRDGKIRHLGVTNFDVARLSRALAEGFDIVAHQVQYSLLDRRPEEPAATGDSMVDLCRRHGVHLLAYGSLAGGFLTRRWLGAPPPDPPPNRSLVKYRLIIDEVGGWPAFQELLSRLDALGQRQHLSIANLASHWVLDRPGVAAVVVGVRGAHHLEDHRRLLELSTGEGDKAALADAVADLRSPPGEMYGLERQIDGPHAAIMKTRLNRD